MGRGEAAAEPGRDDGRLYWVAASTSALEAMTGSASSTQYSSVLSSSNPSGAAASTYTGCGGKGGSGCKTGAGACALMRSSGIGPWTVIVKVVDGCGRGGADREPRRNVLIMSK